MLAGKDILLGKIALGRRLLSRRDALRVVDELGRSQRGGRRESLATACVRLGYLTPSAVRDIEELIISATLECSACNARSPLLGTDPRETERCASCSGGPLHVLAADAVASPSGTFASLGPEEPQDDSAGSAGGKTFMQLELGLQPVLGEPVLDAPVEATPTLDAPFDLDGPTLDLGSGSQEAKKPGTFLELDVPSTPPSDEDQPLVERTMEFDAPNFAPPVSDLREEKTMELDPSEIETGAEPDLREEKTMELDPSEIETGAEPDLREEKTMELDPSEIEVGTPRSEAASTSDAERTAAMDLGAVPRPEWAQSRTVADVTPLDVSESTAEMEPHSSASLQDGPFEPFAIDGGIRILAPVARGGMGAVFRAIDEAGQVLAVKVLSGRASANPEAVARFHRETQLAKNLSHPGIVRVHGGGLVTTGDHEGRPYIVMDYIAGRDLDVWSTEKPRSTQDVLRILPPVCAAIDYAHGRGVVHRDLKPGNILVRAEDDAPLICDFGLARYRAGSQLTRTGDILGTPAFMAPEQARGESKLVGPPTDVYALGAILYFLLTGRPPFVGPRTFALLERVVRETPKPPGELNPEITPALDEVVLKALAKGPVDRYHTCGQLKRALEALLT
jgi:predicted Ser/Thr protein kinase